MKCDNDVIHESNKMIAKHAVAAAIKLLLIGVGICSINRDFEHVGFAKAIKGVEMVMCDVANERSRK